MKPQNMFEQECLSAGGMHPSQIAPFERLVASSDLDGRHGKRRVREGCKIPVESDLEAVQYWIERTSESDSTARMRRGVAEKLFNWAYVQLKKPLSSFEREDFGAFVAFTANPCPADVWIAPRGTMRNSTAWRPFAGPADASSQAAISSNISSLLKFLRQQNYADLQYVHGKRAAREGCADSRFACQREAGANQTEVMPLREWEWVTRHFDMNEGDGKVRLERIVAELLYYAGMKLCDVAAMSQSELWTPIEAGLILRIVFSRPSGKEIRKVYEFPDELAATMNRWFMQMSEHQFAAISRGDPLIGLSVNSLADLLHNLFLAAAELAEAMEDVDSATGLRTRTSMSLRYARKSHEGDPQRVGFGGGIVHSINNRVLLEYVRCCVDGLGL